MGDHGTLARPAPNWPLVVGFLVLAACWLGPLPAMSRTAFSAHMLLHLGVVALAAPLLAIGLARAGLRVDRWRHNSAGIFLVFGAEMLVVWGWHAPPLHKAAALNVWAFVAQQASFLAVGLGVWLLGFASDSRRGLAAAMFGFFLTFVHMTMLGVVLIMAPRLIYPAELCLGAFGFEQLDDQRFGGILMAAWSGVVYLGGAVALAARLLSTGRQARA
ncbi:cytochrome c oxidase assembly protein [Pseudomonas argentinensis]|uniref:Putative membrane protein n=1 Tax=Phytopseudomonas argentinensis TaxID=289370 RepID=A0A1I3KDK8_9GAMM|nr:cytochrome c oxidase assembly protein [Pseudomonas argentinensis]KAB0550663.1 cytochrome c oxidase assembly protein [Pseudomonas argentinensis]SFI70430.1 putative membrane protein [Pseudomonas argentinensis]